MFMFKKKLEMPTADEALPGRRADPDCATTTSSTAGR